MESTYRQLDSFIQTRLDPVLHKGYYSTILSPEGDSIKSKKLRNSFLIFRSANKASSVEGVDIDYLSLDEYDRIGKMAEDSAMESMSSSKFQLVRRWSTPTTPNWGVHDLYEHSDRKNYLHKCSACNHWNKMTYADYEDGGNLLCINPDGVHEDTREVEDGSYIYVCNKCGKPLDRWYNGEWVAERPNVTSMSGYLITQMSAVWISADDIKRKEFNAKTKQTFWNYVVGEPYQDLALALVDGDVMNHRRNYLERRMTSGRGNYVRITVGIDWGVNHSVLVMGQRSTGEVDIINTFSIKETAGFTDDIDRDVREMAERIRLYDPDLILADIGYNGNRIAQLNQHFRGIVYGVQVNPAKSNGQVDAKWSDNDRRVNIDKLTQNRIMLEKIKTGRIGFWKAQDDELNRFVDHWKNVVIRDEEDDDGNITKIITRKGDD